MEGTFGYYLPIESAMHRLDPRTKIISSVFVMLTIFTAGWAGMFFATLLVSAGIISARIPLSIFLKQVKLFWLIIVFTVLFQVLLTPGDIIYEWRYLHISSQGVMAGLELMMRLVLAISVAIILTTTTTTLSLASGLEALLKPLRKLGVPVSEIIMAITIAVRFVPVIFEETRVIIIAQMARGAGFHGPGLVKRFSALISIMVPLLTSAFRRSEDLAMAMEARCYQGGAYRTSMRELVFSFTDVACLLISGATLVITLVLQVFDYSQAR